MVIPESAVMKELKFRQGEWMPRINFSLSMIDVKKAIAAPVFAKDLPWRVKSWKA